MAIQDFRSAMQDFFKQYFSQSCSQVRVFVFANTSEQWITCVFTAIIASFAHYAFSDPFKGATSFESVSILASKYISIVLRKIVLIQILSFLKDSTFYRFFNFRGKQLFFVFHLKIILMKKQRKFLQIRLPVKPLIEIFGFHYHWIEH